MRFVILNGSPKGDTGITIQYVKFIQKHYPQHDYVYYNISNRIRTIERNNTLFKEILSDIDSSDGIIWATPVYTLLVPAQYMRFIELIHEKNKTHCFKNKYTAVISTSIHFYDHTAHRYMNAVCDDLDMNYIGYFSAEMDDILNESGRTKLLTFANYFLNSSEKDMVPQKRFKPVQINEFNFVPENVTNKINAGNKKIIIITDTQNQKSNIPGMIKRFSDSFSASVDLVNLWDINIKGGCTGCIRCGYDNSCIYRDSFSDFYRSTVLPADIVVFAAELINKNLSSKFKEFFDRRFFMNHKPDLRGKQVAFLVSGHSNQMTYMYDFFEGSIEWQNANNAGIIRDDVGNSDDINRNLQLLAETAVSFSDAGYCGPQTFLGVGGAKIFRDDIWGKLRFVFHADYKYYKKNKLFNFPQNRYKSRIFNSIMRLLTKIPWFRHVFYKKIKSEQYIPYKKIVEKY